MIKVPGHITIDEFGVRDNELTIDSKKLSTVVETTPLYIYSRRLIEDRIALLRRALPSSLKLHYAMKANPRPEVVDFIARQVDGLDVASAGELAIAARTGIDPAAISFAGPGKTDRELQAAVAAGIVVTVESDRELARLRAIARDTGRTAKVAVRVNPDFELSGSGMKMSGGAKPFGIDAERVPETLASMRGAAELDFQGLHVFSGSQNLKVSSLCEAQNKTASLVIDLARHAPKPPTFLNIGGGFGIPYFKGDTALDLAPIGENLKAVVAQLERSIAGVQVVIELGRYIVGQSGIYVCRVVDKKVSRGKTYLVTDGGMHHHLAASGNFGQVLRRNYPIVIGSRIAGELTQPMTIVGPLCTPLDTLGNDVQCATDSDVGDLVVIFQSGAYGLTASPTAFLGHPPPQEVLI